jgi:hypothetical protein
MPKIQGLVQALYASAISEPASIALLAAGFAILGRLRRRKRSDPQIRA